MCAGPFEKGPGLKSILEVLMDSFLDQVWFQKWNLTRFGFTMKHLKLGTKSGSKNGTTFGSSLGPICGPNYEPDRAQTRTRIGPFISSLFQQSITSAQSETALLSNPASNTEGELPAFENCSSCAKMFPADKDVLDTS